MGLAGKEDTYKRSGREGIGNERGRRTSGTSHSATQSSSYIVRHRVIRGKKYIEIEKDKSPKATDSWDDLS